MAHDGRLTVKTVKADGFAVGLRPPALRPRSTDCYRRWAFAFRSRDAACLRGAAGFFAEPFRAGAAARLAAFTAGLAFAAGRLLSLARFAALTTVGLATFLVFGFVAVGAAAAVAVAVTFSTGFAGAGLLAFSTSLPGGTAAGAAGAGAGADAAFVDPFGRPPLRANCASANIFLNASCASAIN